MRGKRLMIMVKIANPHHGATPGFCDSMWQDSCPTWYNEGKFTTISATLSPIGAGFQAAPLNSGADLRTNLMLAGGAAQ